MRGRFHSTLLTSCAFVLAGSSPSRAETFEVTYQPPASGVSVTVNAPHATTTPLLVMVCLKGDCKTAAVLGTGLYRIARIIAVGTPKIMANPKAKALPSTAEFLVPADAEVGLGVRSHGELKGSYIVSCGVPFGLKARQGYKYSANWTSNSKECGLRVTERALEPADAPEVELKPLDVPAPTL